MSDEFGDVACWAVTCKVCRTQRNVGLMDFWKAIT